MEGPAKQTQESWSPKLQPRVVLRVPGRYLKPSWEQMLGPEVKLSQLMMDDADLQPEVVRFGERLAGPMVSPLSLPIKVW